MAPCLYGEIVTVKELLEAFLPALLILQSEGGVVASHGGHKSRPHIVLRVGGASYRTYGIL